jgi:hypothetical protein
LFSVGKLSVAGADAGGRGASALPAGGFVIVDIFGFIKWLEHFQEKWNPVFRPKMRQCKNAGAVSVSSLCETALAIRAGNLTTLSMPRFAAQMIALVLAPVCAVLLTAVAALAADVVTLTIKNHLFVPSEVSVPAGERFRIEVENQDATPAEFESADLRVEKIVVPGGKIAVMAGPLKPGIYKFFDDYHPDTAKGTLTAVERKARE